MAIRLSRNIKAEEKPQNGFDVAATEGKNYNLDEIEKLRDRKASDAELVIRNIDDKDIVRSVGDIAIAKKCDELNISTLDYKKYLLSGEKSTKGYTPEVSLRRPIIIWTDGTEDTRPEEEVYSLYNEVESLKDEIKRLQALLKFTTVISADKRDYIPTVGAVIDYHGTIPGGSDNEDTSITIDPPIMRVGRAFKIENGALDLSNKFNINNGSLIGGDNGKN